MEKSEIVFGPKITTSHPIIENKSEIAKDSEEESCVLILGKTGAGKSAVLNKMVKSISKNAAFTEGCTLESTTHDVKFKKLNFLSFPDKKCIFVDTPGFFDTNEKDQWNLEKLIKCLKTAKFGINLIIFTFSVLESKFDATMSLCLKIMAILFGEEVYKHVRIVITHIDEVNEDYIQEKLLRIQTKLPELLEIIGITDIPNPYYELDYDAVDGGLKDLQKEVIEIEKYKPEILEKLNEINIKTFDPLQIFEYLANNSKNMKGYIAEMENLKKHMNNYEVLIKNFENEEKLYKGEIKKLEMENKKIKQANEELAHEEGLKNLIEQNENSLKFQKNEFQKKIKMLQEDQRNKMKIMDKDRQMEIEKLKKEFESNNMEAIDEKDTKNLNKMDDNVCKLF